MTEEEKLKFLNTLKWDSFFRDEVTNSVFENSECERIVKRVIMNEFDSSYRDEVVDEVTERIANTIDEDKVDELEQTLIDNITNEILSRKGGIETRVIEKAINQLAADCLSLGEKEEIKKKVEKAMIKRRAYREDIIDLEE